LTTEGGCSCHSLLTLRATLGLSGGALGGTDSTNVGPGPAAPGVYSDPPSEGPKAVGPTTSVRVVPPCAYSAEEPAAASAETDPVVTVGGAEAAAGAPAG